MLLKSTSVWFPGPGLGVGILYHVIYFIVNKTQSNQPVGGPADRPIRDQFPGHVITLAQSEASVQTADHVTTLNQLDAMM